MSKEQDTIKNNKKIIIIIKTILQNQIKCLDVGTITTEIKNSVTSFSNISRHKPKQ